MNDTSERKARMLADEHKAHLSAAAKRPKTASGGARAEAR